MGTEEDIREAKNFLFILKGIREYLLKKGEIQKLIQVGVQHIEHTQSSYFFECNKDRFKSFISEDFQLIIQYTQEDFEEEYYFEQRKTLQEFNNEYYTFYVFLSKYILEDKKEHHDIIENLSHVFSRFAAQHKK